MTTKAAIVEHLGEKAVLLPSLLGEALAANERLKLRLSLVQEAAQQAQSPGRQARHFEAERKAAGLPAASLDNAIAGARLTGPDRLFMPGVAELLKGVGGDLDAMLAPLRTADGQAAKGFDRRIADIEASLPKAEGDQIDLSKIGELASASRSGGDSLHLLVMDLHREINRLSAETAQENLDGARVHGLNDQDRKPVKAFMRGVNRTAALAFGHPGLGTTAVRAKGTLTIQNDIGATDAHVIVIHVEKAAVTITYTDVHRARAKFFTSLFEGSAIAWTPLAEQRAQKFEKDVFYLLTGRFESQDEDVLCGFLELLGSRIVFLIDWNKARKALLGFVSKTAAVELLLWAANHDYGHRAFLELGGSELIFDAIRRVAAGRVAYGDRLDRALGEEACREFLELVLRDTAQGLTAGRSARLIRDEIQANLARLFETAESTLLTILVRHLGLTRMLASLIAQTFATPNFPASMQHALAVRAKQIEAKGDRLTMMARERVARMHGADGLRTVIDEVEHSTDSLEECAFLISLLPEPLDPDPLLKLARIVVRSTSELVRGAEAASQLQKGRRADAIDALQSIDAVVNAERDADSCERDALAAFMAAPSGDAKALVLGLEIARALETATDHLSHAALSLRDRVMEELSA
jgi:uncharacterized protein Yka (UPF0111/DUF47 family)